MYGKQRLWRGVWTAQDPVISMDGHARANYLMETTRADSPKTAMPYASAARRLVELVHLNLRACRVCIKLPASLSCRLQRIVAAPSTNTWRYKR